MSGSGVDQSWTTWPGTLLQRPRAQLARAVRSRIGGPDFQAEHDRIWHTPGPRWFDETDAIWIVHADSAMFIGGIRALLLQSLHPVAMHGVGTHSGYRQDPWGRLQRTGRFIATTTYGTVPAATESIERVRAIHRRIRGVTPDGIPYRVDEPHLLAWIHAAEVDSFLRAHQAFGDRPLDDAGADDYVRQSGQVAARLGVLNPPQTVAELAELIKTYRPELRMSPPAQEAAELLLTKPVIEGTARIGYTVLAAGAVSLLPSWARSILSLPTTPLTDRLISRPLARSALRTLRWALAGSPAD